ncbi:MAG: hypothetical protein QXO27_04315 [Candidatus Aenigmatarchaeota archaeon]
MKEEIASLLEVSQAFGSGKRLILLYILNEKPMTYTEIDKKFRRMEMKIGSSEIYKHLDILLEYKFIAKKRKLYLITLKGKKLIEGLQEWSSVPPTIPKIEMIF